MTDTPRGIKNCNPLNLVDMPSNPWQGLAVPSNDGRLCVFTAPIYGIRAGAVNLIGYFDRHGYKTIRAIISAWAPVSENDTAAYIMDVCQRTGFGADDLFDLHTYDHLRALVVAIIWHENGQMPYSDAVIDEALKMAGVVKPVTPTKLPDPKVIAATVTAGATAAQQVVANVQPVWDGLNHMGIGASTVMIILGICAGATALWFGLEWWKNRQIKGAL